MIWIEHDMQLVRDLADKVLVLHPGKELALGPPNQVLSDPAVIAAYIGKRRPPCPGYCRPPPVANLCSVVLGFGGRPPEEIISRITRPSRGSRSSGRTS